ncbi:MAG: cryptochrome/photolyase family protein [Granulosicoccus sp.]
MTEVAFIFPHQLFVDNPVLRNERKKVSPLIWLIEDSLFFGDSEYPLGFHKQKLAFHRATMDEYGKYLRKKGWKIERCTWESPVNKLADLCEHLSAGGVTSVRCAEINDYLLKKRLLAACEKATMGLIEEDSPGFLNSTRDNQDYRSSRKRWFMADFYQWQRKRLGILVENDKPVGGQWSFDEDNRKKLPEKAISSLPSLPVIRRSASVKRAVESIEEDYPDNPGSIDEWCYPVTHKAAERWLESFLEDRFELFGPYEDAIVADKNWLYHSILTPLLNTGLLTPQQVVDAALNAAEHHQIPLNSLEGFLRQIIGWREFMRATYHDLGVTMRSSNHWQHTRPLPQAFYNASTGITPVDDTIRRVLKTGYCHHIERLMVLGGFMFLCEIEPNDIYKWFMELFIDGYDWVMVPNVYAMSQHADGGAITTKPYFSGSNYIIKMSNYKKGEWSAIWDALFWRWIIRNQSKLSGNPRWAMMVRNAQRMDSDKVTAHMKTADSYLESLR